MSMGIDEARAWLRGERSWANAIPVQQDGQHILMTVMADAAATVQAYWLVRHHDEAAQRGGEAGR